MKGVKNWKTQKRPRKMVSTIAKALDNNRSEVERQTEDRYTDKPIPHRSRRDKKTD